MRHQEAATQRLRQYHDGPQYLAARMIGIGRKLFEASAFVLRGKWLPWVRGRHEPTMPTELSSFDAVYDALCRTAEVARCWEVNPSIDNDRRLTQLVEQAQDAIARAYPPTETTLRQLQLVTPDGLRVGLIRCADSECPLIAISIDADRTLRWRPGSD